MSISYLMPIVKPHKPPPGNPNYIHIGTPAVGMPSDTILAKAENHLSSPQCRFIVLYPPRKATLACTSRFPGLAPMGAETLVATPAPYSIESRRRRVLARPGFITNGAAYGSGQDSNLRLPGLRLALYPLSYHYHTSTAPRRTRVCHDSGPVSKGGRK